MARPGIAGGSADSREEKEIENVRTSLKMGEVVPEKWTRNFPEALALARDTKRPLLMITGKRGCEYCKRMKDVLSSRSFEKWVAGTGIYLAEARFNETNASPEQARLIEFLMDFPHDDTLTYPHLGIYWPRGGDREIRTVCTWRRGRLPGPSHPTMTGEFVKAMDVVLGDYFATLKERPSLEEILAAAVKHIQGVCEEGGTMTMEPVSGELDVGSRVILTAHPPSGMIVTGWRAPDGRILPRGKTKNRLVVKYNMPAGTYTALPTRIR